MTSDFDPPPRKWSIIAIVGGVATALLAIAALEYWSSNLRRDPQQAQNSQTNEQTENISEAKIAALDAKSMQLPGNPVTQQQIAAAKAEAIPPIGGELSQPETESARVAWRYFENNWNDKTGLVNSADGFASVTMWDQAAAMAALVSAFELELIPEAEFNTKMQTMLKTLSTMPLYKKELPNKVYNSQTLLPVNYGKLDKREEIGWSAIDLGRMAIWLKIVGAKYPRFAEQTEAVWDHWNVQRLTRNGQMYGTSVIKGKEQLNQEGRLGYENYAAYGLKLWGLNVDTALDPIKNAAFVNLYGQGVPYDKRDYENSEANNYVLSEPYILDGIENGFRGLPKAYSDRVLAAQEARYNATKQLTAVTEDNLDREPYFVYSTLFVNRKPWAVISDTRKQFDDLRFVSTKAAIGWHVLYDTPYAQKLFNFVYSNLKTDKGWYNGYYEILEEPNKSQTANNNGVVLESLLFKKVGQPLTDWAGVKPPSS